jgi:fructose-1,6-bisphosphatase/inositol monophosphatase family enzyme
VVCSRDFIASARSVLVDAVRCAQEGASHQDKAVVTKRDGSLVTEIDKQIESMLAGRFKRDFPGATVLGEEGAIDTHGMNPQEVYGEFFGAPYQIIIDPIDGTKNFIAGHPQYCIAVALSRGSRAGVWPVAGAIAIPEDGVIFWSDEKEAIIEDLRSGQQGPIIMTRDPGGSVSVNSRDRAWLAAQGWQLCVPWVSSGSSVYDLLGTVLGRHRASIVGSQRLWDLMAPLAIALRFGLVLRDFASGHEITSLRASDLSDDIIVRPWGLSRKMILTERGTEVSELARRTLR